MKEKTQKELAAQERDDFNRTVIVEKPAPTLNTVDIPAHHRSVSTGHKRLELEDIIGKKNISRFTGADPDISCHLDAPLSKLDTKYAVLEEFAQGGYATVSVAQDKNLRRVVAVKSLKEESSKKSEVVDSFISEAKVTAQLDHPSIIPIYGLASDEHHGVHLVMKLVNGKTLRDYLRNTVLNYRVKGIRRFDEAAMLRKRLEIFLRVCDAIAYAHHRHIMHRDLKPENIMLGEYMEVYVMDWGLAKMIPKEDEPPEDVRQLAGTPRYFSPEALRGERCDARADIFTLGLILQEVVTLQFAIKGKDEKEYMERIVNDELEPVRHLFDWKIDRSLQAVIRKATAYQPEDRYQTVADFAEDLRRYMGGLPIEAEPDDIFMRVSRYFYNHRRGFLFGVLVFMLLFALLTAGAIYKQLKNAQELGQQKLAMNFALDRTAFTAEHIDITVLHLQEQLSALSRITAYLLSYNTAAPEGEWEKKFHPPMDKMKEATPPGIFFSEYYRRLVGLDYGIFTLAPDADRAACIDFMRRASPALVKMKNIVLGSKSGFAVSADEYGKLKSDYLYNGAMIRSVFIGSSDGVKMLYPWRGINAPNVDPRRRAWYQNALGKSTPVWGKPHMDTDSVAGLIIPCSIQIFDLDGKFRGVAGLDLSVNRLTNSILNRGNVGDYVVEKAVINLDGEVIFSTKSEFFNKKFDPDKFHEEAEFETRLFEPQEVRERILGDAREHDIFSVEQKDGRKVVYSFAKLEVLDMYYVVVADYEKLLKYAARPEK